MKSIAKYKLISYSYMDESRGTGSWFFTALIDGKIKSIEFSLVNG